ncbi:hypothetical protein PAALTS15_09975 [Paenibacillus alvei TS-15]|uniref:Uncharacterized protein n=1 Tax=Paenibacillus alvei TS-15 TaxID=1117108 RepID=S9SRX5_PAEAL|nr:hypothetical protein [Paenibacillus alvei]EPY07444.1 hypothetical protein PAALTS15_09975 [Paenibacillus alvei TS-15]
MLNSDPLYHNVPWDIITDDDGQVIGEVFQSLQSPPSRYGSARGRKWDVSLPRTFNLKRGESIVRNPDTKT